MFEHDLLIWRPTDDLYHHGIRGQKWGEKNGPPYPLDDRASRKVKKQAKKDAKKNGTVIPKGTKLAVINESKTAQKDGSVNVYDTNNSHTSTVLTANASHLIDDVTKAYKHEYENTEDLIAPSEKAAVKAFSEAYDNNKKNFLSR